MIVRAGDIVTDGTGMWLYLEINRDGVTRRLYTCLKPHARCAPPDELYEYHGQFSEPKYTFVCNIYTLFQAIK